MITLNLTLSDNNKLMQTLTRLPFPLYKLTPHLTGLSKITWKLMLSFVYSHRIHKYLKTSFHQIWQKKCVRLVAVIIQLMWSVMVWPKGITLSNCYKNLIYSGRHLMWSRIMSSFGYCDQNVPDLPVSIRYLCNKCICLF